jgi:hypothetical protein
MFIRTLCSLLLMAAPACYQDKTIGVSRDAETEPPAPAKPKFSTQITAQPGEIVNFASPNAGDIDGDGFDDFVLAGRRVKENGDLDEEHKSLYLFYGKAEFPLQISTMDADAVFDADGELSGAAGDVNGDGLGDLLLAHMHSVEFAFGSPKRFHGAIAAEAAGVVWMGGELPPPFAPGFSRQFFVQRAGDVNGDGCADLIVHATALLAIADDTTGGGIITRGYLVRGHRGEWKSAVWDPTWASSGFGFDASRVGGLEASLLVPERAGDLDGDGRDDLLATTGNGSVLFYGKGEYPNELSSGEADARLLPPPADIDFPGLEGGTRIMGAGFGDLDGDGMSDLALIDDVRNGLRFVYGRRWMGASQIEPEFEVVFQTPGLHSIGGIATGDIDGDSFPELLVSVTSYRDSPDPSSELREPQELQATEASIYVIRGTGERPIGTRQLTQIDRWYAPGQAPSTQLGGEVLFNVSLGGDVDGDGGQDILTNLLAGVGPGQSTASVYLVPSTPRSPD